MVALLLVQRMPGRCGAVVLQQRFTGGVVLKLQQPVSHLLMILRAK
jgi:hypothetical protein